MANTVGPGALHEELTGPIDPYTLRRSGQRMVLDAKNDDSDARAVAAARLDAQEARQSRSSHRTSR